MRIGVLALQGAFEEHIHIFRKLGVEALALRLPNQLAGLDGLVIPGGESTTILRLMQSFDLFQPLKELAQTGFPIWGTCAGMICLAKRIASNHSMKTLEAMDIVVRRNAFGRQVDSFEADLPMPALGDEPFHAVFIRAPIIEEVGSDIEILGKLPDGTVVSAQQGKLLVSAFHPELTDDFRFHHYFMQIVASRTQRAAKD